ncbi:protein SLOW WALKER 2 [Physcomitrium patens]|uniref:CCAAT-binding factor domain-containing protein n=1 Tax=Physcomitrium patens TaxID=3218 RepID=A0A2K1K6I5_PHYPA|nr:uncharacterized protein C4F10.09c-like [Physcomitrium patens]PNR49378.1 hypothetical protein PHYPA_011274 [Physcomitrium patens]|eukprot:XP_024383278.1 uncharacterized protein C4F10.09c-like [Physcomitrella patens]
MAEVAEVPQSTSKTKGKKNNAAENLDSIQAEVASFAAQLGLTSGGGVFGAGFDDSDFRKTGRLGEKKKKKKGGGEGDGNAEGKKVGKSPGGQGKKGAESKKAGELQDSGFKGKGGKRKGNRSGQDVGLIFGSGKKAAADVEKGKGKKRSWPSEAGEQGNERCAKKERFVEGDSKSNDTKKVVSLDKSLVKSLQSASLWYEGVTAAVANPKAKAATDVSAGEIPTEGEEFFESKRKEAEELMEKAVSDYEKSRSKDSDTRWLMTARRSGTSSDKVAAMTVMLQDNPMLNLRTLDALIGMVTSKGGKRHAAIGIDALKELFLSSLLPDRKLKYLNQQPLSSLASSKEGSTLLLYWYFEDCVKRRYERFVGALEEATKDTLSFLKEKALKTVFELLKAKPEQERRLLSALVNKLGDPERKVASNASYLLSCLLTTHPVMKAVVVEEVDSFLFRPHVGNRARYYAAVFLNQIMLAKRGDGPMVAKKLINLYFALFRTVTVGDAKEDFNQKGKKKFSNYKKRKNKGEGVNGKPDVAPVAAEIDARLLSALLTGVNRAFPYVATDDVNSIIEEHTPVLFRLVHSDNFNVAVQALMLLHQLLQKNQAVSERFYRALYSVLLSPSLTTSNKAEMFLNLLFKALKQDINLRRMSAFAKRLTQVALQQPPNFACGCLLVLSEVLKARPSLWDGILQPESQDDEIEHFVDIPDEDSSDKAPKVNPETNDSSEDASKSDSDAEAGDDDMVDGFTPALEDEGDSSSDEDGGTKRSVVKGTTIASRSQSKKSLVRKNVSQPSAKVSEESTSIEPGQKTWPLKGYYDSKHRDPSHCNADKACWWELSALAMHMHPSVASMARTLLSGANVVYSGDPLRDLVLGAFLDRFAEKKPKTKKQKEGAILPMPGADKKVAKRLVGEELLALNENEVAPDDVVFHKFYQFKVSNRKVKKAKHKIDDEEDDITGLDDVDGGDVDDSDDDEVDALLERDEGREMGSAGEDSGEDDGGESEGEFDYDKMEHTVDMEDDEEDEELDDDSDDSDDSPKKNKKGIPVEVADSDSDGDSEDDFDLGEYPDSEPEDDSDGSIEVGDLPSDDEPESNKTKSKPIHDKATKKDNASRDQPKKKKKKKKQDVEVPVGKKGKSKSPFASFQDYEDIIDRDQAVEAPKGKSRKGNKKSRKV